MLAGFRRRHRHVRFHRRVAARHHRRHHRIPAGVEHRAPADRRTLAGRAASCSTSPSRPARSSPWSRSPPAPVGPAARLSAIVRRPANDPAGIALGRRRRAATRSSCCCRSRSAVGGLLVKKLGWELPDSVRPIAWALVVGATGCSSPNVGPLRQRTAQGQSAPRFRGRPRYWSASRRSWPACSRHLAQPATIFVAPSSPAPPAAPLRPNCVLVGIPTVRSPPPATMLSLLKRGAIGGTGPRSPSPSSPSTITAFIAVGIASPSAARPRSAPLPWLLLNMETTPVRSRRVRSADAGAGRDRLRRWVELAPLAIPVVGVLACAGFSPHWQNNDDIGMSMISCGYGGAGLPEAGVFDLLWGHFVRACPRWAGLLRYSVATFASLTRSAWRCCMACAFRRGSWLAVHRARVRRARAAGAVPQFTVNAGLLMIAAGLLANVRPTRALGPGCCADASSRSPAPLVRKPEALLVFDRCPLLPWGRLLRDRRARFAERGPGPGYRPGDVREPAGLPGPPGMAGVQGQNPLRMRITDYGADKLPRRSPQLLRQQGLSQNDLNLLRAWFFVDPEIADPQRLAVAAQPAPLCGLGRMATRAR